MESIRVRATQVGYLGHTREIGDEFELQSEVQFAPNWMEKIIPPIEKPKKAAVVDKE